jgi:hypothetical protein
MLKRQLFHGVYQSESKFLNNSTTWLTYFIDLNGEVWILNADMMVLGWQQPETLQPEDTIVLKDSMKHSNMFVNCIAAIVNEPHRAFAQNLEQWRQTATGEIVETIKITGKNPKVGVY